LEKGEKYHTPSTQVIIAALNEEEGIGLTIAELQEHLHHPRILVVDGKSQDNTVHTAENLGADIVFQVGEGKGDAISYALQYIDSDVDYIILSDADYTYPAEHIPQMIKILEENPQIGMVCGNRFNSHFHLESMGDVFYLGNRLLAVVHNALNGVALRDPLTGLRAVRAQILKGWNPISKGFDIEVELNHLVERKGFNILEIPIAYRQRLGEKKLKLRHGAVIFKRILMEFTRS
jgi:dolichol-phosphate mannosyltransferase